MSSILAFNRYDQRKQSETRVTECLRYVSLSSCKRARVCMDSCVRVCVRVCVCDQKLRHLNNAISDFMRVQTMPQLRKNT